MTSHGAGSPAWVRPAVVACGVVACVVTALVVLRASPLLAVDHALSGAAHDHGAVRPDWVATLGLLTWLGSGWLLIPAGLVLAGVLVWRGRRAAAQVVVVGLLGSQATQWLIKALVGRERPPDPLGYAGYYGFASGHSQNAATAALLLAVVLWPTVRRVGRIALTLTVVVWAGLVGFTRVALVVHWPSDVITGWALGGLVVAAAVAGVGRFADGRPGYRHDGVGDAERADATVPVTTGRSRG